jgi:multidrug efflux pump
MFPISNFVSFHSSTIPASLNQFAQLNSATISAIPMPNRSVGEGLEFMQSTLKEILPKSMSFDYAGDSRVFIQEGNSLIYAFLFALVIIFLVLAAQFESFRDPLIIMMSVPMAICGALIPLNLGLSSVNIYSQIGLVTLIGLITKHGILMVEFANKLKFEQSLSLHDAIQQAASIRLRPILMTTAAMVFGCVPLILASGAGAASRFSIGIVIVTGLTVGTLFTLFVVPVVYTLISKPIKKP